MEKHHEDANIDRLIECLDWLASCPFTDGQPFYETARDEIVYLQEAVIEELVIFGDEDILNGARDLVEDGPTRDLEEDECWIGIKEQWEAKKEERRDGGPPHEE